ncbi:hypothetical protein A2U01_0028451, partial [Trifolium medium]|nr:hypothetical protein [Trifolium medium]
LPIANGPRTHQLKSELADCKQGGLTVVAYYSKLKTLWDELANYEQIPICKCKGCTCGITSKLEKRREEEKVHQFLMGLDDAAYGNVRSNMLASDPLPSLNRIYSAAVQEERVRSITRTKERKRAGHDVGNCFQLVGYPDWWGDRPKGEKKSGGKGKLQTHVGAGRGRGACVRAIMQHELK